MIRVVLINPWIHDFAAFNLWSAPLGLYNISGSLSKFDVDIHLIDCVDSPVKQKDDGRSHIRKEKIPKPAVYKNIPRHYYRFGMRRSEFEAMIKRLLPIDHFLVTSHMSYWYPGVSETISVLKELSPRTPVTLGGIYATLNSEHAKKTSGADIIYKGRFSDDIFPGLKKVRETRHWSSFVRPKGYAPLLTSHGCPMRCTYCASHVLDPVFEQRPVEDIYNEIFILYSSGVRHFAFYDDALLVNSEEHIVPLLHKVISDLPNTNFYTPVGLQSRLITRKMAKLMRSANFKYIRIGYETGNACRQKETGGKICDSELEQGIAYLTEAGFKHEDIGIFIMYGLPGQTMAEVTRSIEYTKGLGTKVALTEYSPIRGTKEYLDSGIDLSDPLLANNTAYSRLFTDFKEKEIGILKELISRP